MKAFSQEGAFPHDPRRPSCADRFMLGPGPAWRGRPSRSPYLFHFDLLSGSNLDIKGGTTSIRLRPVTATVNGSDGLPAAFPRTRSRAWAAPAASTLYRPTGLPGRLVPALVVPLPGPRDCRHLPGRSNAPTSSKEVSAISPTWNSRRSGFNRAPDVRASTAVQDREDRSPTCLPALGREGCFLLFPPPKRGRACHWVIAE